MDDARYAAAHKTIFGEDIDPISETDGLFVQLMHVLMYNEAFKAALVEVAFRIANNIPMPGGAHAR